MSESKYFKEAHLLLVPHLSMRACYFQLHFTGSLNVVFKDGRHKKIELEYPVTNILNKDDIPEEELQQLEEIKKIIEEKNISGKILQDNIMSFKLV